MSTELDKFPFAFAPDIIRSQQKDMYVEGVLKEKLFTIVQKIKGSRFLHNHNLEITSTTNLIYLALTTLVGARTLGEEYVDIFHVSKDGSSIPGWQRRAGYVLSTSLGPLVALRLLSKLRRSGSSSNTRLGQLVAKLSEANSIQGLLTIHLALFYFSGAYYQFAKRVWGMRYSFGHRLNPLEGRGGGYELLGMLIVLQYAVRGVNYLVQSSDLEDDGKSDQKELKESSVSTDVDLSDPKVLPYIPESSRKCTLCLEYMTNPAATLCGHIFCWTCGSEWCREKPECPLCRQACLEQNLLPLRG